MVVEGCCGTEKNGALRMGICVDGSSFVLRDGVLVPKTSHEDCNDPKPNSFLESLTTTNLLSY
jgi:hypothetical protein